MDFREENHCISICICIFVHILASHGFSKKSHYLGNLQSIQSLTINFNQIIIIWLSPALNSSRKNHYSLWAFIHSKLIFRGFAYPSNSSTTHRAFSNFPRRYCDDSIDYVQTMFVESCRNVQHHLDTFLEKLLSPIVVYTWTVTAAFFGLALRQILYTRLVWQISIRTYYAHQRHLCR